MKCITKLKKYFKFERVSSFAFCCVFFILFEGFNTLDEAAGQVPTAESNISLNVKDKPLGEVLTKITQDTGYTFKLSNQWGGYPISAALEDMSLNQVLERILARLNHAIIYESDKTVNIVIYGKADLRKANQPPAQPPSPQIPEFQQESNTSPELSAEGERGLEGTTAGTGETAGPGSAEEKTTGGKEAAENPKAENAESPSELESKESQKDTSGRDEDLKSKN